MPATTTKQQQSDPQRDQLSVLLAGGGAALVTQHFPLEDGSERVVEREFHKGDKLPRDLKNAEIVILRDEQGYLTRAGMERALEQGGSVMYEGTIIDKLEDLPDEVALTRAGSAQTDTLLRQIEDQQVALDRKKQQLEAMKAAVQGQQSGQAQTQTRPEAAGQQKPDDAAREREAYLKQQEQQRGKDRGK